MRKHIVQSTLRWLGEQRIYVLFAATMLAMSLWAPKFLNVYNLTVITKAAALNALVAAGFTVVMICGELDLSICSTLTLGAMLAVGLRPACGWYGSVAIALGSGVLVGLVNGALVTRARIHSFIATLGTMTIAQGVIYLYSHGSSVSVTGAGDFALADFLEGPLVPLVTPRVLATLVLVLVVQGVLSHTRLGRNVYLVGGNKETAWLAGLNPNAYVTGAFVLSGFTAALGGVLFAMGISSATTDLGVSSLMDVITATIIGGTAMAGGRGSVLRSALAVLTFAAMFNGFNRLGFGSELRIFVAGLVLAAVVLHEAWSRNRHERLRGRRAYLLDELERAGRGAVGGHTP
jgi:ribose transport system permease protein